jgi:hypothetical protein
LPPQFLRRMHPSAAAAPRSCRAEASCHSELNHPWEDTAMNPDARNRTSTPRLFILVGVNSPTCL